MNGSLFVDSFLKGNSTIFSLKGLLELYLLTGYGYIYHVTSKLLLKRSGASSISIIVFFLSGNVPCRL